MKFAYNDKLAALFVSRLKINQKCHHLNQQQDAILPVLYVKSLTHAKTAFQNAVSARGCVAWIAYKRAIIALYTFASIVQDSMGVAPVARVLQKQSKQKGCAENVLSIL
jgi:hypothetical protein